jgi:hypothetical protein
MTLPIAQSWQAAVMNEGSQYRWGRLLLQGAPTVVRNHSAPKVEGEPVHPAPNGRR